MLAYCLNNPVNTVDYDGCKAVDLFNSVEEAAWDFAMCYNGLSISNNVEYATSIYSKTVTETRTGWKISMRLFIVKKTGLIIGFAPVREQYKYKVKVTKYSYKTVKKGGADGVSVPNAPLFKKRVATAHTHAAYDPAYANDIFSGGPGDKQNADRRDVPNYVATPLGTLRRYNPADGSDVELYNDIPWDPNHPSR